MLIYVSSGFCVQTINKHTGVVENIIPLPKAVNGFYGHSSFLKKFIVHEKTLYMATTKGIISTDDWKTFQGRRYFQSYF
jgi:hypothetical protein